MCGAGCGLALVLWAIKCSIHHEEVWRFLSNRGRVCLEDLIFSTEAASALHRDEPAAHGTSDYLSAVNSQGAMCHFPVAQSRSPRATFAPSQSLEKQPKPLYIMCRSNRRPIKQLIFTFPAVRPCIVIRVLSIHSSSESAHQTSSPSSRKRKKEHRLETDKYLTCQFVRW